MGFTEADEAAWQALLEWEKRFFQHKDRSGPQREEPSIQSQFDKLNKRYEWLDALLFHLHSLIENAAFQTDARDRLLKEARDFDPSISEIGDLKHLPIQTLNDLAEKQMARHRLLSLAQGGLSGTGSIVFLGIDLPMMLTTNLCAVQMMAQTYGYSFYHPLETLVSLKVFYIATIPRVYQYEVWKAIEKEVEDIKNDYFYEGDDTIVDTIWFENMLKQIVKAFIIMILRKKAIQGIPLFGMLFGAGVNYQFARKVTEIANKFYQKRLLHERRKDEAGQP